jgi:hypothetical protein
MTYQRPESSSTFAAPEAIDFAFPNAVSAPSTNTELSWASRLGVFGTSGIVITSNRLVLPAGYWYYLEGTAQALSSTYDSNDYLSYRWYNHTTAAYAGAQGRVAFNATSSDALLHSYDERAVCMLYAAVDTTVSLRCLVNSGCTWANYQNTGGEPQVIYAGNGRGLIIKLDGPAP